MRIRVLGCSGGVGGELRTTSLLIDDDILIDAGSGVGELSLEEMQGGNFSISNLGGIGGTSFTPVVNSPEVAILGVSRSEFQPVFHDGQFEPRLMLPLSLSYDHRLIDGADAARFLRWVAEVLEKPFKILLDG